MVTAGIGVTAKYNPLAAKLKPLWRNPQGLFVFIDIALAETQQPPLLGAQATRLQSAESTIF